MTTAESLLIKAVVRHADDFLADTDADPSSRSETLTLLGLELVNAVAIAKAISARENGVINSKQFDDLTAESYEVVLDLLHEYLSPTDYSVILASRSAERNRKKFSFSNLL